MIPHLLLVLLGLIAPPHPLHSSSATLMESARGATLTVRIFTDDLDAVAPGGDSAVAAYVRQHVRLAVKSGAPVRLEVITVDRDGDRTQVTARVLAPAGLEGLRVQQAVLWERYDDQINLFRASIRGRSTTMVFANGDPPREV